MQSGAKQKIAVVTGASAGIGKATAHLLAQARWRVICTGRDAARCAAAEAELRAAAPAAQIDFLRGDFAEMRDVRRIGAEIAALTGRLDVLINNAGGVRDARYVTGDGFEATFAANHLAPFLLTQQLLPMLQATAATAPQGAVRIIAVSSSGHAFCPGMNWDDLNFAQNFTPMAAYCQAKLANILFTRELARRFADQNIIAQAMHPGRVSSNFASHGDAATQAYMADAPTPPEEPARTLVWLASAAAAGAPPGRYFHGLQEAEMAPQARDDAAAARLWQVSEDMLAAH